MAMLKDLKWVRCGPGPSRQKASDAIRRAEYAKPEEAHTDIVTALSYLAHLLDAVETKVSKMK